MAKHAPDVIDRAGLKAFEGEQFLQPLGSGFDCLGPDVNFGSFELDVPAG